MRTEKDGTNASIKRDIFDDVLREDSLPDGGKNDAEAQRPAMPPQTKVNQSVEALMQEYFLDLVAQATSIHEFDAARRLHSQLREAGIVKGDQAWLPVLH